MNPKSTLGENVIHIVTGLGIVCGIIAGILLGKGGESGINNTIAILLLIAAIGSYVCIVLVTRQNAENRYQEGLTESLGKSVPIENLANTSRYFHQITEIPQKPGDFGKMLLMEHFKPMPQNKKDIPLITTSFNDDQWSVIRRDLLELKQPNSIFQITMGQSGTLHIIEVEN